MLSAIIIIVLVIAGYLSIKAISGNSNEVRYVLASVEKGTLITSVSGTGQVSALNQVNIKAKTAGDIVSIAVKSGQEVKKGDLIAQLDTVDAQKAVRDAQMNLELAKMSLEEANISQENSESDVEKAYEQGFNAVSEAFSDFPGIISGLYSALFNTDVNGQSWNMDVYKTYRNIPSDPLHENDIYYKSYHLAKSVYEKNLADYASKSRTSNRVEIESLLEETYETSKKISEALKNANNLIQLYKNDLTSQSLPINLAVDTHLSSLNSHMAKANSQVISLFSAKQLIQTQKNSTSFTVKSKSFDVEQKENALADAREKLWNCSVRSPIGGVVASVDSEKSDSISLADSIATVITKQSTAEISLNEIDAAKIKASQKATLAFDAVESLSVSGEVVEIDAIGSVSQGVVSYNVKIAFDTQDDRIKPGMSVSASIIIDIKQDVLIIPNSAVKTLNNSSYVEVPNGQFNMTASANGIKLNSLNAQAVETGLSNDSYTEVVSGLKEGDQIVSRTITNSSKESASNLFQAGGSGNVKIMR